MNQPTARLSLHRHGSQLRRRIPVTRVLASGIALWVSFTCGSLTSAFGGAILYWDGDGIGLPEGGAGTWDVTSPNWSTAPDSAIYQPWNNANGDDAVLMGQSGAKTVNAVAGVPIVLNSLTFTVSGYTLGSSAIPFQFNSPTGILTVESQSGLNVVNAQYDPTITTIIKNGSGLYSSGLSQTAYAGKWVVNSGILSLPGDLRLGIVPASVVPDQVTLDGGFLRSSTATVVFNANRGIVLGVNGGGFDSLNTNFTWNGPISGTLDGALTKREAFNLILTNNANSYNGVTRVENGRLTVGAANALGDPIVGTVVSSGAGVVFTGATSNFTIAEAFEISGNGEGTDGGAISVTAGANVTLSGPVTMSSDASVTVSGDSTVVFSNINSFLGSGSNLTLQGGEVTTGGGGTITGSVSLDFGSLSKIEQGKWTLAGVNAYTGLTSVTEGTLIVSGAIVGTSQVEVTGTLGGGGTITPAIGGNIAVLGGGKISPGNDGVGTLSAVLNGGLVDLSGGVTLANSLTLVFDLAAPNASDKMFLTNGAFNIGIGVLEFDDFSFSTLPGFLPTGDYVLLDGSLPLIGTLGTNLSGTIDGFSAQLLLGDGGRDIILSVVPEPNAAMALLTGAAALLGLRRRRS